MTPFGAGLQDTLNTLNMIVLVENSPLYNFDPFIGLQNVKNAENKIMIVILQYILLPFSARIHYHNIIFINCVVPANRITLTGIKKRSYN